VRLLVPALLLLLTVPAPIHSAGEDQLRDAAQRFGRALRDADASALRPILPSRGKVQLILVHLGPEEGYFSSRQVEALFRDFFKRGSVQRFELLRIEGGREGHALAHGRADLIDPQGRPSRVELHLALQPEGERWVVREIREMPR